MEVKRRGEGVAVTTIGAPEASDNATARAGVARFAGVPGASRSRIGSHPIINRYAALIVKVTVAL